MNGSDPKSQDNSAAQEERLNALKRECRNLRSLYLEERARYLALMARIRHEASESAGAISSDQDALGELARQSEIPILESEKTALKIPGRPLALSSGQFS